jgi:hypothetical protein
VPRGFHDHIDVADIGRELPEGGVVPADVAGADLPGEVPVAVRQAWKGVGHDVQTTDAERHRGQETEGPAAEDDSPPWPPDAQPLLDSVRLPDGLLGH